MQAFSGILGALGGAEGLTKGAQGLTGLFGMMNQFSQAQKQKALVDRQIYYSKHPEAISNLAKSFEKPLDQGLVKGTENVVNASMAEQGLSQAPGIQSQVLAQALAPYQQNSQAMALQEAFKAIGLPAEALAGLQSSMDPNSLAMMLKSILPGQGGGGNPAPALRSAAIGGGVPTITSSLPDWIPQDSGTSDFSSLVSGGGREG